MLYKFKLGHNTVESTKNISVKGEVDHNMATRWLKKFFLGCKNLNDQARSGRPETVLQPVETNPAPELIISHSSMAHFFHNLSKSIWSC